MGQVHIWFSQHHVMEVERKRCSLSTLTAMLCQYEPND